MAGLMNNSPYGPINAVQWADFGGLSGWSIKFVSDDYPNGWGKPYSNAGIPINAPIGTPGGEQPVHLFNKKRSSNALTVKRSYDHVSGSGNWYSDDGKDELSWHSYRQRYVCIDEDYIDADYGFYHNGVKVKHTGFSILSAGIQKDSHGNKWYVVVDRVFSAWAKPVSALVGRNRPNGANSEGWYALGDSPFYTLGLTLIGRATNTDMQSYGTYTVYHHPPYFSQNGGTASCIGRKVIVSAPIAVPGASYDESGDDAVVELDIHFDVDALYVSFSQAETPITRDTYQVYFGNDPPSDFGDYNVTYKAAVDYANNAKVYMYLTVNIPGLEGVGGYPDSISFDFTETEFVGIKPYTFGDSTSTHIGYQLLGIDMRNGLIIYREFSQAGYSTHRQRICAEKLGVILWEMVE